MISRLKTICQLFKTETSEFAKNSEVCFLHATLIDLVLDQCARLRPRTWSFRAFRLHPPVQRPYRQTD